MAMNVLDSSGLSYLWGKIKPRLAPTVTSLDNGKVLGVENGAWTKSDMVVVLTMSLLKSYVDSAIAEMAAGDGEGGVTDLDSGTFAAAKVALDAGKRAILRVVLTDANDAEVMHYDCPLVAVSSTTLSTGVVKPFVNGVCSLKVDISSSNLIPHAISYDIWKDEAGTYTITAAQSGNDYGISQGSFDTAAEMYENGRVVSLQLVTSNDETSVVAPLTNAVYDSGGTIESLNGKGQMSGYDFTVSVASDGTITVQEGSESHLFKKAKISKITDYLYYFDVDFDIDYEAAIDYAKDHTIVSGACTSFRKGNFVGRNFDFAYDEKAEFIVSTKSLKGRHAVIGVSTGLAALTNTFVDSGVWSDLYEIIPCAVTDGINDRGVYCCMNSVNENAQTYAEIDTGADLAIPLVMIPRYVLDNADSADHAILLIQDVDIIPPFGDLPVDLHFLIADATKSYVVEYVPDGSGGWEMVYYQLPDDDDHLPVLTNFYLHNYFADGMVVGGGKNRYDAVVAAYSNIANKQDYADTLESVYSTKANQVTFPQTRNGTIFHTAHSCVYDIANRSFAIKPQPDVPSPTGEEYHFAVNGAIRNDGMSYDDLADRPFYEIGNDVRVSLTASDYNVSGAVSFNLTVGNSTFACKLLRVANYTSQNVAKTAYVDITASGNTVHCLATALQSNTAADGYYLSQDGFPLVVVARTDGTSFVRAESDTSFSVTIPTAGTYLLQTEYGSTYVSAFQTHAVKKLDEKYYDGTFWVSCVGDLANTTVSNVSHTYPQIVSAYQDGKTVKIRLKVYTSVSTYLEVTGDLKMIDLTNGFVNFETLFVSDANYTLTHLFVRINSNDATEVHVQTI